MKAEKSVELSQACTELSSNHRGKYVLRYSRPSSTILNTQQSLQARSFTVLHFHHPPELLSFLPALMLLPGVSDPGRPGYPLTALLFD
ncbi:hypothetical protein RRG08_060970 [Elysia crispata]|uniref:Uncharacterized protein n=1 Tax=Elysia crispata TaxID=231223 RepID=A0AAE1AUK3_9GAST|nr:hypothetical protein RRG08_060970 [Elysia crispata]